MPKIKVVSPFALRLDNKTPRREFRVGDHEVNEAELSHWFIKACLADGRAVLLAPAPKQAPAKAPDIDPAKEPEDTKAPASDVEAAPAFTAPEDAPAKSKKAGK
jgi:hypothetical protein